MGRRGNNGKRPKINGKVCQNAFEYDLWREIKGEAPPKSRVYYEAEKLPYVIHGNYVPDFVIRKKDGSKIYIEAKGNGRAFNDVARRKMASVRKSHPDLDIRIVFYSDAIVRKGGKMRNSDWAKKNGYPFAIRNIPKGWFNE